MNYKGIHIFKGDVKIGGKKNLRKIKFRIKGSLPSTKDLSCFWYCSRGIAPILGNSRYRRGINIIGKGNIKVLFGDEIQAMKDKIEKSNLLVYHPNGLKRLKYDFKTPLMNNDFIFAVVKNKAIFIEIDFFKDLTYKEERKELIELASQMTKIPVYISNNISIKKIDGALAGYYNNLIKKIRGYKINHDYKLTGNGIIYSGRCVVKGPVKIEGKEEISLPDDNYYFIELL